MSPNVPGCSVPANAGAFVLNATLIPTGARGFLTLWPNGGGQLLVSTLNATDGSLPSNLAIGPVGNGLVKAFTSNESHLILDTSGYFAQ